MATVWIVLSGSRCGILGFALASIVTLERCRRSCGGALSRNLYRGSINLWCPADSDRPTDGWAVSLAIFKSDFLVALGWIFAKRSLPLSGRAVVHKLPTVGSQSVGYHQMPLETDYHTAVGRLWVNSPPDLREGEGAIDNNAFLGVWGVYPLKQRAQPFALRHLFFSLCKFYRFSIGVL